MSFSFCCRSLNVEGCRRHPLHNEIEEEEEENERVINISELREEYRSSREKQRRNIQVLIYRTVSVELKDAISIIPINQNLSASCGLYSDSPPSETFDEDPTSCDPWLVPLGLHQISCPRLDSVHMYNDSYMSLVLIQDSDVSVSRRSLSSKTASSHVDPPSSSSSDVDHISTSRMYLTQSSVSMNPRDRSNIETSTHSSSTSSLNTDLRENWSTGENSCNSILQNSSLSWRGSRKSLRFTRQLSVGGLGQNFPFPCRRTRRISEAVRRLGMYSSV